jgi:hypothetical protein
MYVVVPKPLHTSGRHALSLPPALQRDQRLDDLEHTLAIR